MTENNFHRHEIEWTPEKTNRLWDYYSSNAAFDDVYFGARIGKRFARILQRRKLLTGARNILDMSCGKGNIILACGRYLRPGQQIRGVDVSEQSISRTKLLNADNPCFAGATHLSEIENAFQPDSQDLLFSTEVIEHLTDDEVTALLDQARRLLSEKGTLVLTTPNDEVLDSGKIMCPECGCIFHRWQHRQSWSPRRLTERVESAGFRVVECKTLTWEAWFVDLYFTLTGRKKPGMYLIAEKQPR